ncbi:MAG: hypothetical protein AUI36_14775 [Cyanobacteria bacterium 13_1_40CM_2_61_4]|nr:MAG: hypothetical protein AUI36_14775 [Cyanobacteria bacterium 13_1_40CM_2_61_4]
MGLKAADFPSPTTVADFLTRRPNRDSLVVVVDEAGQIGARQMLELVRFVRSLNGRLILSGDTRQHGPVEASDALLAIERFAGLDPAELECIRRQNPDLGQTKDERASIAAYRRAVEAAAAGRLQESFDRLDRMGAVIAGRFDEQADKLAGEYLRLTEQACSTVVVSQTWGEVHRVNQQVRAVLKSKGILDGEERIVPALEKVDLTSAQKRDPRFYDPATVIVFNQPLRGVAAGSTGRPAAFLGNRLLVEVGQRIVMIPARYLDRINVCRPVELSLSPGDRLQLKANRKQSDGASVTNGELVTVRSLSPDGVIELQDGRVLDANYREFVPGYAVTSYGSQGRTVDYVLFSDQRSRLRPTTSNGTLQFREAEREFASSRRTKSSCAKTSSGQAKGSSRWKSSAR